MPVETIDRLRSELEAESARVASEVDDFFARLLHGTDDSRERLYGAMRHAAIGGGKRLRPLLTIAASQLFAIARERALRVGCAIEAEGVVFHVGSHLGAGMDAGLDRVVAALKVVLDRCSDTTWLLMENTAGTGATIGRSVEELALLFDRLERHPRLGICLDSCHLYASGYDVTDEAALDSLLDEVDRELGLDRLRALHVNDSATPLGSNRSAKAGVRDYVVAAGYFWPRQRCCLGSRLSMSAVCCSRASSTAVANSRSVLHSVRIGGASWRNSLRRRPCSSWRAD